MRADTAMISMISMINTETIQDIFIQSLRKEITIIIQILDTVVIITIIRGLFIVMVIQIKFNKRETIKGHIKNIQILLKMKV